MTIYGLSISDQKIAKVDMLEIPRVHYAHSCIHDIRVSSKQITDFSITTAVWAPINSLPKFLCAIILYSIIETIFWGG